MPELPEVETAKNGILPYVKGTTIQTLTIRTAKLRHPISPELFDLANQVVLEIQRRAKYLIFKLNNGYILVHLGMSGSLRLVENTASPQKHDHIDMLLDNGKILRYNDPRKFGAWLWVEDLENYPLLTKLGPEPLTEAFSADYLYQVSRKKTTAIKTFLMNNQIVVGVGNIYANESLFLCGIHPTMPAMKLTQSEAKQVVTNIKKVLSEAIKQGGTTLQDFLQPDGRPGYFAQQLLVYGRKAQPCVTCRQLIESMVIGQRNSFYCPQCQTRK
ncbi:DNA-formamidopyrimidine glycosylase [Mergibacter septicus]|uniref:bifunctional DNA-formamidopyrimidine glycosylase/DNA-(apurinic or apyrimidinic site) lyase n=1 Tax=Mergibacter septicus TaxID=221402 RepID=UPI00117963CC|nr:bifunctional DNA-formamidopyrimidine glycosylase/DNA-(apurinic or apyrimidinic site) lyase [Mergibacter septicus]AWX14416.1 DNA-formamidopyrimidine glycosylase [Mergibacter septicus]